jgi:hypothetical protein
MNSNWIIKPLVPEEVYTDRQEFLEYFYHAALEAGHRRTMSTVLLGQRRMGKTEIFKRVVNRLFFEQDPKDPKAAVPVYFSFPDSPTDAVTFGKEYLENFLRYYAAFYTRDYTLIRKNYIGSELAAVLKDARSAVPCPETLDWMIITLRCIEKGESTLPHRDALEVPRRASDNDDTTVVMFLDEFQNTRLPQYNFDIVGYTQEALESPTCPHFVTGSAISILSREIIGRGALFGRFDTEEIKAMSGYYGAELAMKAARYHKAGVSELAAPLIAERCGGNPFYINAVIRQAAKQGKEISGEEVLNEILAVDITSGFIWGELNDQVTRWISRVNEYGITKWILYLSALDENIADETRGRLDTERIRREVKKRSGEDVSHEQVRDILIKLSRGDLLEYLEGGEWFRRINDPILNEFLRVWGRIEAEGHKAESVRNELEIGYGKIKRQRAEYKGYLAEIHMSQSLINGQRKTLPGRFFNSAEDVKIPDRFIFVRHRFRLGSGEGKEIDVLGAAGPEQWVCQSKWITGNRIGISVLKTLKAQADAVMEDMNPETVRMWLFAHNGLTPKARAFAEKHGILWSSRKEFDELLAYLGLRTLPDL